MKSKEKVEQFYSFKLLLWLKFDALGETKNYKRIPPIDRESFSLSRNFSPWNCINRPQRLEVHFNMPGESQNSFQTVPRETSRERRFNFLFRSVITSSLPRCWQTGRLQSKHAPSCPNISTKYEWKYRFQFNLATFGWNQSSSIIPSRFTLVRFDRIIWFCLNLVRPTLKALQ